MANKCRRFRSTLMRPCVVFAMIGNRQMMNAINITCHKPVPNQFRINGATATMGTVCSRIVYG